MLSSTFVAWLWETIEKKYFRVFVQFGFLVRRLFFGQKMTFQAISTSNQAFIS